jgi:membrane protein
VRRAPLLVRLRDALARLSDRSPFADHVISTVDRYLAEQGSLLAAGMTYYGFLALFPLLAVGLGVTSVLSRVAPSLDDTVRDQVHSFAPGVDVDALATAGIAVGVIGLVVSLYAGVRWVSALRRSLTLLWGRQPREIGYVRGLLRDIVTLALLGACVLASIALTIVSEVAYSWLGDVLGQQSANAGLRISTSLASLVTDVVLGLVIYRALPGPGLSGLRLLLIAALAGAGFEVLKQAGTLIVGAASTNVVYGAFAGTVGALIFISYGSRWILLVGAFAATFASQPGGPSGGDRPDGDGTSAASPADQHDGEHDADPGRGGAHADGGRGATG